MERYNYQNLSKSYEGLNNTDKALEYYKLYSQAKDSLFNEEKNKQITEMETRYQTEKKEQQIKLQKTEIAKKDAEAKKQKIIIFSVIGILVLAIAFAFVLYNRFRIIRRQKNFIQKQKAVVDEKNKVIEQKNKDITDSIQYAKTIQEAILTSSELCKKILPQHFILFKPKDIVSGDFYWAYAKVLPSGEDLGGAAIWTVADCTGHGVPGAFMSMIGSSLLNEIIIEKGITTANEILNELKAHIIKALGQTGATGEARDGMDAALCIWYKDTNKLEYAGAYNPLYLVRKNIANSYIAKNEKVAFYGEDLAEFKPDKQPIGYEEDKNAPFTKHEIQLQKGDTIYTFSDGYKDQFGGPNDKKFSYKRFRELLISIQDESMQEQKEILDETIEKWRGEGEQIDDICVIGVRV